MDNTNRKEEIVRKNKSRLRLFFLFFVLDIVLIGVIIYQVVLILSQVNK